MARTEIRALSADSSPRGCVLRGEGSDDGRTLYGHFAVVNTWTEIHGAEGHFMERMAPGAFLRSMVEDRAAMRVLLSHGFDPTIGDKPIGVITTLREDGAGAFYEAELLDGLDPLVVSGLRAGQYGASFRFRVMRERFDQTPARSEYNQDGIPERTVLEVRIREIGPTPFPAYDTATANLRDVQRRFDDWALRLDGRQAA